MKVSRWQKSLQSLTVRATASPAVLQHGAGYPIALRSPRPHRKAHAPYRLARHQRSAIVRASPPYLTPAVHVLIVDDHTLVRAGLCRLLQGFADVQVIAEASNAEQALELGAAAPSRTWCCSIFTARPQRPSSAFPDIRKHVPQARVVMMSMHDDCAHVRSALDRGAVASCSRTPHRRSWNWPYAPPTPGRLSLSPPLSAKMLAPLLSTERPTGVAALPPRQRQILRRLGSGQSTKEIAAELGISAKTVKPTGHG